MNTEEYQKIVKKYRPKEPRIKNAFTAFIWGGLLGFFSEVASCLLVKFLKISVSNSYAIVCISLIFIASLLTALGVFDNLVEKGKCGLIIPTTGFAHSVASSGLEYRKDGLITGLGSNFFKLAGSVILYGMISAFFLCILKVVIYA